MDRRSRSCRWTIAGLGALAACAPTILPPETALIPSSPDAAFECGLREVNQRHYTVQDVDRSAWFIRAEHFGGGGLDALIRGVHHFDVLTLSVYPLEGGGHSLRVVADAYEVGYRGEDAGNRDVAGASKSAQRDAREILGLCGVPADVAANARSPDSSRAPGPQPPATGGALPL